MRPRARVVPTNLTVVRKVETMTRRVGWATIVVLSLAACSSASNSAEQSGTITVEYEPTGSYSTAHQILVDSGVMDTVAAELTDELRLVTDLHLLASECGTSNAYYDPQAHQVTICYELVEEYRLSADLHQRHPWEFVESLVWETTYHEIAHALIDQLDLPITGNEEDVADQFVIYQLLPTETEEERHIIMDVIHQYTHYGDLNLIDDSALADPHSLDSQRAYNYSCYLYGSDREAGNELLDEGLLTTERAEYCGEEFTRATEGWEQLLAGHRSG